DAVCYNPPNLICTTDDCRPCSTVWINENKTEVKCTNETIVIPTKLTTTDPCPTRTYCIISPCLVLHC
ncbi:unnamed protein product, partial [Didymodactylos carnosus]